MRAAAKKVAEFLAYPPERVVLACTLEPGGQTLKTEPCSLCDKKHVHGAAGVTYEPTIAGHRTPHCTRAPAGLPSDLVSKWNDAFRRGYWLKLRNG